MAEDTETQNGTAPTPEGRKLVERNYADRAVAALPDTRVFTDDVLRKMLGDYDPEHLSVKDMRRMRQDLHIKLAMHYRMAPVISADYSFECDDPQIAAATQENYDEIHVALMKIALNSWWFGFQGAVKQYEYGTFEGTYEDPETGEQLPIWDREGVDAVKMAVPIPLPPEVTEPKLEKGKFAGIVTPLARLTNRPDSNDSEKNDLVPVEWSLWFAHEFEEEFRNYMGRSALTPAYQPWYSYWANYHMRDRHAEADADPALQVWYPPGGQGRKNTPEYKSNRDKALEVGRQLRSGATVAWPTDLHVSEDGKSTAVPLWRAEFLQGGENLAAFTSLLDSLKVDKIQACLVPEQTVIEAIRGSGSRNVTGEQIDLMMLTLEVWVKYFDRIINKYYIRPFVEANFGKDSPPCIKVTTGFQQEDMTLFKELVMAAFTADPNALPIKFEELLKKLGVDQYSKKEQEEREEAIREAEEEAAMLQAENEEIGPMPGEQQAAAPMPGNATNPNAQMQTLSLSAVPKGDDVLQLAASQAPAWAKREGQRRDRNVSAIAERLFEVVHARYEDVFEAAAEAIADEAGSLELGVVDTVQSLIAKIKHAIEEKIGGYRGPVEDEMAGMYHSAGAAELLRLGLDAESWDVGRDEVQEWAYENAGRLITTMDQTVVEKHLRPWLVRNLTAEQAGAPDFDKGIPVDALELSARMADHFKNYPQWMAERVVRTEARMGYNLSAADMWERIGIEEVVEFDGLGGKTGQTDEDCLRRNGQTVTIDEFREDDANEHPNGTLGAIPVTAGVELKSLYPGTVLHADARQSRSIYAITGDGLILSQEETGRMLAV